MIDYTIGKSEVPMFSNIFSFSSGVREVPNVDAVIKRCREIARGSAEFWSSADRRIFGNVHQCDFLAQRVKAADSTLAAIQQSLRPLDSTIPVLQELYQLLHNADMLMRRSHIIFSSSMVWIRAAMEQGDRKETFSHLIYDIEWCTSLLQCILLEHLKMSSIEFEPTLCNYQLCSGHKLALLKAMEEDEMDLSCHIGQAYHTSLTGFERDLALKLHAKHLACHLDLVFVKPEDLDLEGELIGRGSFGVVRKSNFLNGKCAVKILEQIQSTSIEKEIDAIRKLGNHPHIVRHFCYSKNDLEREVYLVMELLDMDLERAIRKMKGLPVVEAVSVMLQIGEGMKYMHDKGVAHRDLKPGNVLVNFDNFEGCSRICSVKIADFGSTKAAERTETNTMGTGTTRYMAPEVMKAKGDPEKARLNLLKADVYSFAMMSVHILTGKYPFELSNQEIKERSKAGERPILRYELPNCPLRLATLLTKCWSHIPHERPPFPEICRELRYIKGLLLRGDEQKLQEQFISPYPRNVLGRVKLQGPWGCTFGGQEFYDMATSIRSIELGYVEADCYGPMALFKVTYEILGKVFTRESYLGFTPLPCYKTAKIELQPDIEYIKQISGVLSECGIYNGQMSTYVSSLTIHTNLGTYGPFGEESGRTKFSSDTGSRVIGFYGEGSVALHRLGVVTVPDI